jgi:hypothetical protein
VTWTSPDTSTGIWVLDPRGQALNGTVNLEFQPQTTGQTLTLKGQDASKEIDVGGLQRAPNGFYKLNVIPTDVFKPVSQFVTIPATGFATVNIVIDGDPGTGGNKPGLKILQGDLVFDYGLAAAGITMRL